MRMTNRISRSIAKWTFAIVAATVGFTAMESSAFGHHPFLRHHGCFGWGSHHFGGYSSFYSYRSSYAYPSFSFGYAPRYYSVSYFAPAYIAPVYYTPIYYTPTYYAPSYYAPVDYFAPACNTWGNVNYGSSTPLASSKTPSRYSAFADATALTSKRNNSPLSMPSRFSPTGSPLAGIPVAKTTTAEFVNSRSVSKDESVQLVSHKPALLQPYSPIWTKAAVGIVDEMIASGELDHAHSSCKSMERIAQPKGAGVYLRQAILGYFSADAHSSQPSTEAALNSLELACQAGSQVQPNELDKVSLHSYFAACSVDVSGTMERLSQTVLESPDHSHKDLLLLAALLKLDGQSDRARLFANQVQSQLASGGPFQWHNLLNACLSETL